MTRDMPGSREAALDAHARRLHDEALRRLPQRTLMQLRARATAAAERTPRGRAWALAAACAAVVALAIGLRPASQPADTAPPRIVAVDTVSAANDFDTATVALEEDPDLFLWLASSDAQPLAME